MFDRAETDTKRHRIPIALTLNDGAEIRGTIASSRGNLADVLADGSAFLEIEDLRGRASYLSKKAITWIATKSMPKAGDLKKKVNALPQDNPFLVLGLAPDADDQDVALAYKRLTKSYHPDRLSTLELPQEMVEYGAAMQRRLNLAYEMIQRTTQQERTGNLTETQKSEKLYESRPHWIERAAS